MAQVEVRAFCDENGHSDFRDWLLDLKKKAPRGYKKCLFLILALTKLGDEIKMPLAKPIGHGISELRGKVGTVNYRPLYSLLSNGLAVITHGFTKEDVIPPAQITLAANRVALAKTNIEKYTTDWKVEN